MSLTSYQSTLRNIPQEFLLDHLTSEDGTDRLFQKSVNDYQSTMCDIKEIFLGRLTFEDGTGRLSPTVHN